MRWFAVIVVAGFAALVLTYYAGWDDAAAPPSQERTGVTAHTSPARLVLWQVTNGKPSGLPVIIDGKSGSKSKTGVRC